MYGTGGERIHSAGTSANWGAHFRKVRHSDCHFSAFVKRILALFAFAATIDSAHAQTYGSEHRKEYEKEKNGPHGECRTDWRDVAAGISYRRVTCLGDEDDVDMHLVRVDPKRARLDAAVIRPRTARSAARELDADFVLNANFFDKARQSEGIVMRSGDMVRSPRDLSWQSIFLVTENGTPSIVPPSKWSTYSKRAWMAVQAGPRLVVDGKTQRVHQSYTAARAGVCIQWDRDVVFFATPQDRKLDMYEIARIARRGEIDGGLGCREAMLFDGGHSVNLVAGSAATVEGDAVPVYVFAKAGK